MSLARPMDRASSRERGARALAVVAIASSSLACGRVGFEPADAELEADAGLDASSSDTGRALDVGIDASGDVGLDAPVDAPLDAPSARELVCRASSTLACLDFETEPPSPWVAFNDGTTAIARTPGVGFHGAGLRVETTGATTGLNAGYQFPVTAAIASGGLHLAARMHVTRAATTAFLVLTEVNNQNFGTNQEKISLDFNGLGQQQLVVVGAGGISREGASQALDRWICVRWSVTPGAADAFVDTDTIHADVPFALSELRAVSVGPYAQADAVVVVVDDVVLSTVAVDCLP